MLQAGSEDEGRGDEPRNVAGSPKRSCKQAQDVCLGAQ